MPPTTKVSKLGQKYGAKANAAVVSHAEDDTTYGFIALPPGITNGIAQLQRMYFEQYKEGDNKGEYYLRAQGQVIEPRDPVMTKSGPMIVKGLTTSIMIPVCETTFGGKTTSQEDNLARILLEMRRLGGPDYTAGATIDDLEDLADGLVELAPFFKFTTQPRIAQKDVPEKSIKKGDVLDGCFENWHGTQGLEDYEPPMAPTAKVSGGKGNEEVAPPKTSSNGKTHTPLKNGTEVLMNRSKPSTTKPEPKEEELPEETPDENAEPDLDALAADADDNDSETAGNSAEVIMNLGKESGLTEKWMTKIAKSWSEVVEAIREKQGSAEPEGDKEEESDTETEAEEEETSEEEEETHDEDDFPSPSKGDEVGYHPVDPKTKKRTKSPVKCIVESVNVRTETVNLKSGKASYKDIEWTELVPLESE